MTDPVAPLLGALANARTSPAVWQAASVLSTHPDKSAAEALIDLLLASLAAGRDTDVHTALTTLRMWFSTLPASAGQANTEKAALARRVFAISVEYAGKCASPYVDPAVRVQTGAQLILSTHSIRSAYDELVGALAGPRAVAEGVLRAVEDVLDKASLDANPPLPLPVDERWREHVAALRLRDDVGCLAQVVGHAFGWFTGQPVAPVFEVDLGEAGDPPFPFLVLGWEEESAVPIDLTRRPCNFLYRFSHQYGGYSCLQVQLIGVALPLSEWDAHAAILSELAAAWYETAGNEMNEPALAEWSRALANLGPFTSGHEALLRGAKLGELERIYGRPLLQFRARRAPWWPRVDLSCVPGPHIGTADAFAAHHAAALGDFAQAQKLGPARLFVLWGNSD